MTLSRMLRAKMSVGSTRWFGASPHYLRITPHKTQSFLPFFPMSFLSQNFTTMSFRCFDLDQRSSQNCISIGRLFSCLKKIPPIDRHRECPKIKPLSKDSQIVYNPSFYTTLYNVKQLRFCAYVYDKFLIP